MKKYLVQTGWDYSYPFKTPVFEGDIEILAINKTVAAMSVEDIGVHLCLVLKEVSAKDIEGTELLPKSNIPYLGMMNYIAN